MDSDTPKQFMYLAGKPVVQWSIEAFESVGAEIVVVLPEEYKDFNVEPHRSCVGGATRFASVKNGLAALDSDCDFIAVHDGVRPLVSKKLILSTLECAQRYTSGVPSLVVTDSLRRMTSHTGSSRAEDRTMFRTVQTPQIFRADILRKSYESAKNDTFTDDASVIASVGYRVAMTRGERRNIKITEPVDLRIAEVLMKEAPGPASQRHQ